MIGVFGGTFDPVHFGHLRPALEVQQALGLQQLRYFPAGQPPHRDAPRASAPQRLAMLQRALQGQADVFIDERELHRPGPSFMVDTLQSLRQEFASTPLCLILGLDAFLSLPGWHQWQRLPQLAHLVVAHRPGWSAEVYQQDKELQILVEQRQCELAQLSATPVGGLVFIPVTQLDISATLIREQVQQQQDIRYLLPDSVAQFIQQQNLYR